MTLRFLGAGGAFSRTYGTTCSLLTLASGDRWLIDCGRQAPDQIWEAGLTWHELQGQIITHVHGDHVFGLEDFAFQRFYQSGKGAQGEEIKPVFGGGPRPGFIAHSAVTGEVWECLGPSLRYLRKGDNNKGGSLDDYFAVVSPTDPEPPGDNGWPRSEKFEASGLAMVCRENLHVPGKPSVCLEIAVEPDGDPRTGKIAWWSGDSTVDPDYLTAIEPRTSVFFHDATFTDYPGQVHGSFTLLEQLPEAVRKKLVLMHHEDDIMENKLRAEAAGFRVGLPGQVYNLVTGTISDD